jgi:hypothetical protein
MYRMNRQLLHEYLLFLLSDDKMALLIQKATPEIIHSISESLLKAIAYLPAYYALPVLNKWMPAATMDVGSGREISKKTATLKKEEKQQKVYPWLIVLLTLFILIAMYYFSKK